MKTNKISKRLVSHKRSTLKTIAIEEKQAAWELSDKDIKQRVARINHDFAKAFKILQNHTDTVTFFGSARFEEDNPYYKKARELAGRISRELQLTVVSGGGPGIMEAANRGAREACQIPKHAHKDLKTALVCGDSVGLAIELPHEQKTNKYVHHSADFYYFFSRKVALAYAARAFICFPGGFGTMDEFFEVLTLKQTHKIPNIPIILVGSDFWTPLLSFIDKTLYKHASAIDKKDMDLYVLTDDFDEIVRIVDSAKLESLKAELRARTPKKA